MENQTILQSIKDFLIEFVWAIKPEFTQTVIQMGSVLALVTAATFLFWMYSLPLRSTLGQILGAISALAIALQYPIPRRVEWMKGFYCFEMIVSLILILFLPQLLALFLTPQRASQLVAAKWMQRIVWVLIIFQLFL